MRASPIGRLAPISGADWRTGRSYEYFAYVPEPLPDTVALSEATWAAVGATDDKLARLDRVARKLAGAAIPAHPIASLYEHGATGGQAFEWARREPLTAALVNKLQAIVVSGTRGDSGDAGELRRGNVFLGGHGGPIEFSRFVPAPHGARLGAAFEDWIQWLNRTDAYLSPVVQAGLAHYQFETLHPYSDANGRVGRLAIVLALVRRGVLRHPILGIAAWLDGHRAEYQDGLLELSCTGDWNRWVAFFASAIGGAADATERRLRDLLDEPVIRGAARHGRPRRRARTSCVASSMLAAVALAACGGSNSSTPAGVKGKSEVVASPISTAGANPFSPSVGTDKGGVMPPAGAGSTSGGAVSYVASLPGLYGGTRNYKTCDAQQLVSYLQQNPAKAGAWASTLGISTADIPTYVSGLTPVLLRTDTRVTNHGYINGVADPIQSILEAGTAVFVNSYGEPVVKCYCGNPLTAPELLSAPVYTGPLWASFTTINITIIKPSPTIINTYTLYDPNNGSEFMRPAGSKGRDGPYIKPGGQGQTSTTGATTPPTQPLQTSTVSTTSAPAPSTTQQAENPSISLSPNPVVAGGTVTLTGSGFLPNKSLQITVNRPDGGTDHFSAASDAQGNVTYTFQNAGGSITGTYQVTVTDTDTNASASASIDVLPPPSGSSPNTTTQ
ncbi:MAG TPA: DUF6777 domain-containing protein [Solirubrobacteraceae bacterium]|nr:DUF6777 domain-containing protein [Solirubrobacteraceae bacterium]